MKKNYLLLISLLGLFSCSQDQLFDNKEDVEPSNVSLRSAGDGIYDVLGYGYDITDEYMGETAVKRQVVNIKAFIDAGNAYKFDNPLVAIITDNIYVGENATAFTKDIMKKTNFNGSATVFPDESRKKDSETASFSGSVTKNSTSTYSYSSKYSFARADLLKKHRQLFVDASPLALSKYLHQQFTEDLTSLTPDQIVVKYGTHVMTDIIIGGFYKAIYKSSIVEEASSSSKSKTVEAGLKVNLNAVGLSLGGSTTTTETITLNQKNTNWSCEIKTIGGTSNGHTVTLTLGGTSSTTLNLNEWAKSVDDKNSKLVELNWNATYPIYDFITDVNKKAAVKAAVERYIASKKISVMEVIPLYGYYSGNAKDHYITTNWSELGLGKSGYGFEKIIGYIQVEQVSGTTPLYGYYSGNAKDHYATTNWSELGLGKSGYGFEKVIGYVYSTQVDGTIPLYGYYSGNAKDHYVTTNWSELGLGKSGYGFEKIMYYTFSAN